MKKKNIIRKSAAAFFAALICLSLLPGWTAIAEEYRDTGPGDIMETSMEEDLSVSEEVRTEETAPEYLAEEESFENEQAETGDFTEPAEEMEEREETSISETEPPSDAETETAEEAMAAEENFSETAPEEEAETVTEETTSAEETVAEAAAAKETAVMEEATEETSAAEEKEGSEKETDLYAVNSRSLQALKDLDFSSMRLIVGTEDAKIFADRSVILSSYDGIYLLQFSDKKTAIRAYAYYMEKADFVEVDTGMAIAEGMSAEHVSTDTVMTGQENPLKELAETKDRAGSFDIALIDTGADGADASVSMIGDSTSDDNGHGTQMLAHIRGEYPEAKVLSIKALGADGKGDVSAVYAALRYAMEQDVKIINLSLSALASKDSKVVEDAVNEAVEKGIIVVGSAGNNGRNARYYNPGRIASAIIVGSAKENGERGPTTNYGETVDYNIPSDSTSQAAAKMSGWIARHGIESLDAAVNNGYFYVPDYEAADAEDPFEWNDLPDTAEFTAQADKYHMINESALGYNIFLRCKETNKVAYCVKHGGGWPTADTAYEKSSKSSKLISYIMYYGYPRTKTFTDEDGNSEKFSAARSRLITQYAIWLASKKEGWNVNNNFSYIEDYSVYAVTYGKALYKKALNYDGSNNTINSYGIFLEPTSGNANAQEVVVLEYEDTTAELSLVKEKLGEVSVAGAVYKVTDTDTGKTAGWFVINTAGNGYVAERAAAADVSSYEAKTENADGVWAADIKVKKNAVVKETDGTLQDKTLKSATEYDMGRKNPAGTYWYLGTHGELTMDLAPGNYEITEALAPINGRYKLNPTTITVKLASGASRSVTAKDDLCEGKLKITKSVKTPTASIELVKTCADTSLTKGNPNYSLKGAVYGIYSNAACTAKIGQMTTDANGKAVYSGLSQGTYYVKELTPPPGYRLNSAVITYDLSALNSRYGKAATFTVYRDPACTDKAGTLATNDSGVSGTLTLPVGDYYVAETTASANCGKNTGCTKVTIEDEQTCNLSSGVAVNTPNAYQLSKTVKEQPEINHIDLAITKSQSKGANSRQTLKGAKIVFQYFTRIDKTKPGDLSSLIPDRTWVFQTDENGEVRFTKEAKYFLSGELFLDENGKAGIPHGSVLIYEQTAPAGYFLNKDTKYLMVSDPKNGVRVYSDSGLIKDAVKIIDNEAASMDLQIFLEETPVPTLQTTLIDREDEEQDAIADGFVTLIDKVSYKNVLAGKTYQAKGKLVYLTNGTDASGKEHKAGDTVVDKDGKEVTAESQPFTGPNNPQNENAGTVDVIFAFDASALDGQTVVAFEELYCGTERVAVHADLTDKNQTLRFPEIGTTLEDAPEKNGGKDAFAEEEIVLVDTVNYRNLLPGKTYVMTGTLMDQETGEPVSDDEGNAVTASESFTPQTADGSVEVTFRFSGVDLAGKTVVAFETLERDGKTVAVHTMIEDECQTMFLPKIGTSLTDNSDHDALAEEIVTLNDRVEYENLLAGETYILEGILMDRETGTSALDDEGEEITGYAVFTPFETKGTETISFTFPGLCAEGKSLVAFETLYRMNGEEKKVIAEHKDLDDEGQTVDFPAIRTHLGDITDKEHDALAKQEITLVDTVTYENLHPGKEYLMKGILMTEAEELDDAGNVVTDDEGNPVKRIVPMLDDEGCEISSETAFTPETKNGTVDVTFTFSGITLKEQTMVAFETLEREGKLLAVHADIEDEDQTVFIPKIGTTLVDSASGFHITGNKENVSLTDTVAYRNLIPGKTYRVEGVLIDKEKSGEEGKAVPMLQTDPYGTVSEIRAISEPFVPETPDGSIELVFEFCGTQLEGHTAVAFEKLCSIADKDGKELAPKEVANHEDLDDTEQTVHIPNVKTTLTDVQTGGHITAVNEEIELVDHVVYENLIPGEEYVMSGVLMDQDTGQRITDDTGKEIRAEETFVPEAPEGSIDLTFRFSGVTLSGKSVTAFETCYYNGTEVAVHADIHDEEQTVCIPKIGTSLMTEDGNKKVSLSKAGRDSLSAASVTLNDHVFYDHLETGSDYVIKGSLMDKSTGDPLKYLGKKVTSEKAFTAKQASGQEIVTFAFSPADYAGKQVVAFEELYRKTEDGKEVLIVVHKELENKEQTVTIGNPPEPDNPTKPEKPTRPGRPKTGDSANLIVWILLAALAAGGIGGLAIWRKSMK